MRGVGLRAGVLLLACGHLLPHGTLMMERGVHGQWLPAVLAGLVLAGCGEQGPPVVVIVSSIPEAAVALEALAYLDETQAQEHPTLGLSSMQEFSFYFRLPGPSVGRTLLLAAAAKDARGCLVATGTSEARTIVQRDEALPQELRVPLKELVQPICTDRLPVITRVSPGGMSTKGTDADGSPTLLTIEGWGFHPRAAMRIGGQPAARVMWISVGMLMAEAPALTGKLGDKVTVELENPGGDRVSGDDLLVLTNYGDLRFSDTSVYSLGEWNGSLPIADFSGDGRPDLAGIVNDGRGAASLAVVLNPGDGTFTGAPRLTPFQKAGIFELLPADLNGDGKIDLLARGYAVATPLISQGDGTFVQGVKSDLGPCAVQVLADVNGDRQADMACHNLNDAREVLILLNQGGGTFDLAHQSSLGLFDGGIVGLAALNEDDLPDLLLASGQGSDFRLVSMINQGQGRFIAGPSFAFGSFPGSWLIADVNSDGRSDLLFVGFDTFSVLLNQGSGAFSTPQGPYPGRYLNVGDLTGDGLADVYDISGGGGRALRVLANVGGGRFAQRARSSQDQAGPLYPFQMVELNGDGKLDLVGLLADGAPGPKYVIQLNTSR